MPLRMILTRHGESTANVDGMFANRVHLPGDLTSAGRDQARVLARNLAAMGATHLYASPLPRAVQTAEIIAGTLRLSLTVADALREYDVGDFEGLAYTGDHAWRMDTYWQIDRAWASGDLDARHPGGESLRDVLGRVLPFMDGLSRRHGDDDLIVAIGHGGLWRAVMPHLFNPIPETIQTRPAMHHGEMIVAVHTATGWHLERRLPARETLGR